MADIKFTKTELRTQQVKFDRLKKYLPTLQLKKALLQVEVIQAQGEIEALSIEFSAAEQKVAAYSLLFTDRSAVDVFAAVKIDRLETDVGNIAGVDIPCFKQILFEPSTYTLFDTPIWFESAIMGMKELIILREKIKIAEAKKRLLEKELRDVSIRVNLFEKIFIPRTQRNIKKIKIFLGDQQLAAVSQAKVAKKKILLRTLRMKK